MASKFENGDIVETIKGAKFWGEIIAFDTDEVSPGCTVRAVDPGFEGTKHVYPIVQIRKRSALARPVQPQPVAVERVEMVSYETGYRQPAEPMWRIVIDDYCADFETETAAINFASAINKRVLAQPVPTTPAVGAVKQLEWVDRGSWWGFDAKTVCGTYNTAQCRNEPNGDGVRNADWFVSYPHQDGLTIHKNEAEAKAAAQADYERRIRSALTTPAVGDPSEEDDLIAAREAFAKLCENDGNPTAARTIRLGFQDEEDEVQSALIALRTARARKSVGGGE